MQANITQKLIQSLKPDSEPYEIRDQVDKGFIVRVQPSGVTSYIVQYRRGKRITLGKANLKTPTWARTKAKLALGMAADGASDAEIREAIKPKAGETLSEYITGQYEPWISTNRKSGVGIIKRIKSTFFEDFKESLLIDITPWQIEKWRKKRKDAGRMTSTINRDLTALKASLNKAVEWGVIAENPIAKVRPGKTDSNPKARFLNQEEEGRLRDALSRRDEIYKQGRSNGNAWREKRRHELKPEIEGIFSDHLSPMVLITINTGLRRGELFSLQWGDVNLDTKLLTVHGATAKSGTTRHIPLNDEALSVLMEWKKSQNDAAGYVFPGKDGTRFNTIKKSWQGVLMEAKINNFRWHDLRHHFASRLVMAGVNLYVVKNLLGHSSIQMTERYAHLAPDVMAEAVSRLVSIDLSNTNEFKGTVKIQ